MAWKCQSQGRQQKINVQLSQTPCRRTSCSSSTRLQKQGITNEAKKLLQSSLKARTGRRKTSSISRNLCDVTEVYAKFNTYVYMLICSSMRLHCGSEHFVSFLVHLCHLASKAKKDWRMGNALSSQPTHGRREHLANDLPASPSIYSSRVSCFLLLLYHYSHWTSPPRRVALSVPVASRKREGTFRVRGATREEEEERKGWNRKRE